MGIVGSDSREYSGSREEGVQLGAGSKKYTVEYEQEVGSRVRKGVEREQGLEPHIERKGRKKEAEESSKE